MTVDSVSLVVYYLALDALLLKTVSLDAVWPSKSTNLLSDLVPASTFYPTNYLNCNTMEVNHREVHRILFFRMEKKISFFNFFSVLSCDELIELTDFKILLIDESRYDGKHLQT